MTFVIRSSRKADFAAIDALLARVYPKLLKADYPPSVLVTALPAMSRARPELVGLDTYYVAEECGEVRAAGGWTPDRTDTARAHVRHVVCDDRHLRRGIARALLERCFEDASAAGFSMMECWSTRTGVAFYEALGFESLGEIDVDMGPGIVFPSMRMIRSL